MPTAIAKTCRFSRRRIVVRLAIGVAALGALATTTGASAQRGISTAEAPTVAPHEGDMGATTALLVPKRIRLIIGYRKTRTA